MKSDTLLMFTADHSFDLRIRGGRPGTPILEGLEAAEAESPKGPILIPALRMDNGHAGEEVLVAAQGPGAQRVRGAGTPQLQPQGRRPESAAHG